MSDQKPPVEAAPTSPAAEPVTWVERGGVLPPFVLRETTYGNERDCGIFDSKGQLVMEVYEVVAREFVPGVSDAPTTGRTLQEQLGPRLCIPVRINSLAVARIVVRILNANWNSIEEEVA